MSRSNRTLNEELARRGLHASECSGVYARVIRDAQGNEVFRGDAKAVREWLSKKQLRGPSLSAEQSP